MRATITIHEALKDFAKTVTAKMTQLTAGQPEDQLRGPFENLMSAAARALGWNVVCTGETLLPDRIGRPDYAVHLNKLLAGFVELKAPGIGANVNRFSGRNREQWKRFSLNPNILYIDGNEWALYRSGELVGEIVRFSGNVTNAGSKTVSVEDADAVERLLRNFLLWHPIIPVGRNGKIDLESFAALIAPLCRMLRDDVTEALKDPASPLVQLAKDWRQLLFPDASDEQFADAYAQTVTFALLLGRSEGASPLTLDSAESALAAQHNLLSRALQVLTDPRARAEMVASLDLLLRVIAIVPIATLTGPDDPWLYFYEDFLATYDPKLRKDVGAYYTPIEVVRTQVRLVDDLLMNQLGVPLGFADPGVVTLDPAAGTGTYLLGVISHALGRIEAEQGIGAVPGQATALAANIHGFELMVGPYAVTELRVSRALRDRGATLPKDGTHVYLTDTLESPNATPSRLPFYLQPIAEQHARALKIKKKVPVIVCLGNPPYDRHEAASDDNKARTGGWVRWGDDGKGFRFKEGATESELHKEPAIFQQFLEPAVKAGHGVHVKNLYNLYVYFWRWALWKVFEHETARGPGVVSFITASSYLDGDAFRGMREHMRRLCDEIWILDLGGEGRGARKSDNVFAIQTPVAIAVAVRFGKANNDSPAKVHYACIEGERDAKLAALVRITDFSSVKWRQCADDWQASFRPAGTGQYFDWPILDDLMPWSGRGIQFSRTWPVAEDPVLLTKRWNRLLAATGNEQRLLLKETRDVRADRSYESFLNGKKLPSIGSLKSSDQPEETERILYRSFDRQWCIADRRLIDMPRPALWQCRSNQQVFLIVSQPLSNGPALVSSAYVPDLNAFRGSCGGLAYPLFSTADATVPNILPGLPDLLGEGYRHQITPEDFVAYVYGTLAHAAFTARYARELETGELRVPITKSASLFEKVRSVGARLLWLHSYGERFVPKGKQRGRIPSGVAKCVKAVPSKNSEDYPESFEYNDATLTLRVGGGEFRPVARAVYDFEISGLKVVQSWLKYRMKKGAGKKSSPLDDIRSKRWTSQFTTELLELLWVLEATLAAYSEQAELLESVIAGPCFLASELPPVPDHARKPPQPKAEGTGLFEDL
jgi:hypothetical protein